jgi:uncharacterized membrane protein
VFFSLLLYYNNDKPVTWPSDGDGYSGIWLYMGWFWLIVSINLVLATVMSFLVERPLMNLSKAIDV